eukprot:4144000-Prymnesium_polylepis.1
MLRACDAAASEEAMLDLEDALVDCCSLYLADADGQALSLADGLVLRRATLEKNHMFAPVCAISRRGARARRDPAAREGPIA